MSAPANRKFTRETPLAHIFKGLPPKWQGIRAGEVRDAVKKDNALLGVVLMACVAEQINFLCCIYDEMYPDADLLTTFRAIVNSRGHLLSVLDWRKDEARERVLLVYLGVCAAREVGRG